MGMTPRLDHEAIGREYQRGDSLKAIAAKHKTSAKYVGYLGQRFSRRHGVYREKKSGGKAMGDLAHAVNMLREVGCPEACWHRPPQPGEEHTMDWNGHLHWPWCPEALAVRLEEGE
jgi:hypothetical protein